MTCLRSVLMMMVVCAASSALAAEPREAMNVVSIRIHDYSQMHGDEVRQAEQQVSDMYAQIGVRLDWRGIIRPADIASGRGTWPTDMTTVTMVVLAPAMTARLHLPEDIAGYAPISRDQGGRVAFVLGSRIRDIARQGDVSPSRVLAGVFAHELAHLLMPQRTHSKTGVMRAHWRPTEFADPDARPFSSDEAATIRQTVRLLDGATPRVAD